MGNVFERIDNKILATKLEKGIEILRTGSPEEISAAFNQKNKNDLISKLKEMDKEKIKDLKLNIDDIKKQITEKDLEKIKMVAGKDGNAIIDKIKELLK